MKHWFVGAVAGAAALVASAAPAMAEDIAQYTKLAGSEVSISLPAGYSNTTLTISGPNGFYARSGSKSGNASIDLIRAKATADGIYTFEVTAATSEKVTTASTEDNGRGVDDSTQRVGVQASGSFSVSGGMVVEVSSAREESK